jgi:hypothetical protein
MGYAGGLKMTKKNSTIVVCAPANAHIRIARRDTDEATHEILASWEVGLLVKLLELHITRTLSAKYGEGICWDWKSQQGWRELLPLTGEANLTVHLPTGEDQKVLLKRMGGMNIAIVEEQIFSLRS